MPASMHKGSAQTMNLWMAALPGYIPHYGHDQQIAGSAVFVAILLVAVVVSVIRYRRGR
jgi:hypothetical protein